MSARSVPVSAVGENAPAVVARAAEAFAHRHTLADVLAWAREQRPPVSVAEIVTQDEYTHDVVLPFDGKHFLAFDAT
jgi:pantothenate kinase